MKTILTILLMLITCTLFCSQNSVESSGTPEAEQTSNDETNLIVTAGQLDFSKHKVTFIELGADKCIPCKAMQPVMHEIAQMYKGTIQVVFYDVWKTPDYAKEYGIKMIPTQVFFDKTGDEIFRHVGFFAKDDILKMLKEKGILQTK